MDDPEWMRQAGAEVVAKWRGLVSEQTQSGQSAAQFCRERDIRVWQFYDWRKRLVEAEAESFLSVELKPAERSTYSSSGDKAIEVRLRWERSLVVAPGFDASHLHALLAVLEREG
jgi:hypothetical protein